MAYTTLSARDAPDSGHAPDVIPGSNMPLMIRIALKGKLKPSKLRSELQQIWQTTGLLSALVFTMQQFTSPAPCDTHWCSRGHAVFAGLAMLGTFASLVASVSFQLNVGFVPDRSLCSFLSKYETSMQAPTICLLLGGCCWLLDAGLQAFALHGMVVGWISVFAVMTTLTLLFHLYFRMRGDVRAELVALYEAEDQQFHQKGDEKDH